MYKNIKKFLDLLVVCLAPFLAGCTHVDTDEIAEGPVTVAFSAAGTGTRALLDPVEAVFSWEEGDRTALWAWNASGETVLNAQPFSLMAMKTRSDGYFTSTIPAPMPEGDYTYFVSYPVPDRVTDGTAVYLLPSEQDGAAGGLGLSFSGTFVAGALRPVSGNGPVGETLSFRLGLGHALHYLRFYIPDGCNVLGEPVTRLEFSMPQGIAGSVNFDLNDFRTSLANASSDIVLLPDTPKNEGEYMVAGIYPPERTYADGEVMKVRIFSNNNYSELEPIRLAGRDFKAGHITAVPLRPKEIGATYRLAFRLDSNNLGEDVQKITINFPQEISWRGERVTSLTYERTDGCCVLPGDSFSFLTFYADEFRALSGLGAEVSFESENAVVSSHVVFPAIAEGDKDVEIGIACPYLMFEDFSAMASFTNGDAHSSSNIGSKDPHYIESGWGFARAGGEAGKAVRLAAHTESVAKYNARCDSPVLNGIKPGKSVSLEFSFNYSMNREEGGLGKPNNGGATVYVGWTEETGDLKSGNDSGTSVGEFYIKETTGSYDSISHDYSIVLDDMTSDKRIFIREVADDGKFTGNGTYWIYIDNIIVKIKDN